MRVNTYLNFPGNCAEALDFYGKHLGAKTLMKVTFGRDAPAPARPQNLPPGLKPDGIHARAISRWATR